jgi:hypothetical protein
MRKRRTEGAPRNSPRREGIGWCRLLAHQTADFGRGTCGSAGRGDGGDLAVSPFSRERGIVFFHEQNEGDTQGRRFRAIRSLRPLNCGWACASWVNIARLWRVFPSLNAQRVQTTELGALQCQFTILALNINFQT